MMVRLSQGEPIQANAKKRNPGGSAMNDISETVERNAREFWAIQDHILDSMQEVAAGWFERRHTGTQAALEAAQRMSGATTPLELLPQDQAWVMGAFERALADAAAAQGCGVEIGRLVGEPLARAAEQGATAAADMQSKMGVPTIAEAVAATTPVKPPALRKTHGVRASAA